MIPRSTTAKGTPRIASPAFPPLFEFTLFGHFMNVRLISVACILTFALQGAEVTTLQTISPSTTTSKTKPPPSVSTAGQRASQLFAAGNFSRAAAVYHQAYRTSLGQGDLRQAIRYLNNFAGCRFSAYQYSSAMEAYLEARRIAVAASDYEVQGAVSINIASLYLQMSDLESAAIAAEQGLAVVYRHRRPDFPLAALLTLLGRIRSLQSRQREAAQSYRAAIDEAMAKGNVIQMARSWDAFGYSSLRLGQLEEAETCLIESYRLRLLFHLKDIHLSYTKLALLRLAQHDLASADTLSARAVDLAGRNAGGSPLWHVYHTRGLVQEARGDLSAAFSSYTLAIEDARRWRLGVLPADALRASTDEALNAIYGSYVRAGARLYFKTGRRNLIGQTFEVMEQSRAASLRESAGAGRTWLSQLPPEYGEILARLRSAEAESIRRPSPLLRETARQARLQLLELETRAGLSGHQSRPAGQASPLQIQQSLLPGECLVSFLVEEHASYSWTVTRTGISLHQFAGRRRLGELVEGAIEGLRSGHPHSPEAVELARQLFLQNKPNLHASTRWLLELDDVLFRAPVAALPDPTSTGTRFIVERHAVEVLPSALMRRSLTARPPAPLFVGVGDPVYNSADPRNIRALHRARTATWFPPWLRAESDTRVEGLELPRLAASGDEVRRSARAWSPFPSHRLMLLGAEVTRDELKSALDRRPSVIHFATHVLKSSLVADDGMIALSLGPGGEARFLDSPGIRLLHVPGALVVLSGCSTGAGHILRGAGLMGLTRAWLLAGARSVVASQWPTPDDSGEFFVSFYRFLRAHPGDVASALQRAQLDMLRSRSWRSEPSYWAAYFTYGRH